MHRPAILVVFAVGIALLYPIRGAADPDASPSPMASVAPAAISRGDSYRLTAKDVVKVAVFGEEDLTNETRIASDGTISCPLIGEAKIGGKTVREAAAVIQDLYKKYLRKPEVTVSVTDYAKRRFTILGQVAKPGTFDMPDDSTLNLIEAVGLAGGFTRIAMPSKVTLKRSVDGHEIILHLDGTKMLKDKSVERVEVLPGDTILVPEGWF